MKQGSSGLTLRELQAYHKTAFELTPKKVANWAQNLPMANVGESSTSVYRLLVDTNQSIIDADKRLQILSLIEPVAGKLISSLEKQFHSNHIALTDRQKKIAALIQAIHTELAIGFHTIIETIVTQEFKRANKKPLTTALVHALHYHALVMLRCFQLYTVIPRRIWKEVYCLYQIAAKNELEHLKVTMEYLQSEQTIFDSTLRILLLSVANPYQLHQREIELLWLLLPELTAHVSLKSHAYNKQHYVIDIAAALPPIHKSLHKSTEKKNCLKLTVSTAIDHLNAMLANIDHHGQQNTRKIMLLRHLIQTWNHGTHRAFARTPCEENIEICIGLGATHYLLMEKNKSSNGLSINDTISKMEGSLKDAQLLDVATREDYQFQPGANYLSSSGVPKDDVWDKLYQTDKASFKPVFHPQMRSRDTIVRDNYKFQTVSLLNMSPNGYCIQIPANELPKHAQTGEIIGFLEFDHHQREHWSVGVVRWVRRHAKGALVQMGIQLLAPGVTAINIKRRNSKKEATDFYRGLLLPELTGIGQPATILTNPLYFSSDNKVRIVEPAQSYNARLLKEIATTTSYSQFAFEKTGEISGLAAETKNPSLFPGSGKDDDIDEIWDIF
ncbi:hypothetical protein [Aliikangiella maris]|uniref:PilZ domain-containing protein n=2 Tax=Aliikangiella maris TaxID=3162458 RepID=A0ABV3MQ41_9GAMM